VAVRDLVVLQDGNFLEPGPERVVVRPPMPSNRSCVRIDRELEPTQRTIVELSDAHEVADVGVALAKSVLEIPEELKHGISLLGVFGGGFELRHAKATAGFVVDVRVLRVVDVQLCKSRLVLLES